MFDPTLVSRQIGIKYPAQEGDNKKTWTFRNIAVDANSDDMLDFAEAAKTMLYNPAMEVEYIKTDVTDLFFAN